MKGSEAEGNERSMSWEVAIPLVTDVFFLWDAFRVFAITALFMSGIFSLVELASPSPSFARFVFLVPAVVGMGLFLLTLLVALVFFLNRYWARFTLDAIGVRFESARWTRKLGRAVSAGNWIFGLLKAMPVNAGIALLHSGKEWFYPWEDIRRVTFHPKLRVISLKNGWRTVIRIYCPTEEHYRGAAKCVRRFSEPFKRRA